MPSTRGQAKLAVQRVKDAVLAGGADLPQYPAGLLTNAAVLELYPEAGGIKLGAGIEPSGLDQEQLLW